jgi:hypothetical protein
MSKSGDGDRPHDEDSEKEIKDDSEKEIKDNTTMEHNPDDLERDNVAPPGAMGFTSRGTGINFSPGQRIHVIKDHEREIQKQRDSRPATGRSDMEREAEQSNLRTSEKSPFLGNEFKDANKRDEGNNDKLGNAERERQ